MYPMIGVSMVVAKNPQKKFGRINRYFIYSVGNKVLKSKLNIID
jgi:hypothetical protein